MPRTPRGPRRRRRCPRSETAHPQADRRATPGPAWSAHCLPTLERSCLPLVRGTVGACRIEAQFERPNRRLYALCEEAAGFSWRGLALLARAVQLDHREKTRQVDGLWQTRHTLRGRVWSRRREADGQRCKVRVVYHRAEEPETVHSRHE